MLAHAFLAVVRADEHARHPTPDDLIPLSCNEICRLFIALVSSLHDAPPARWSDWRRRHQARSQASHYRRQAASDMKITIYSWSTSRAALPRACAARRPRANPTLDR